MTETKQAEGEEEQVHKLYPDLPSVSLAEAASNLSRYLALALRIADRHHAERSDRQSIDSRPSGALT